MGLVNPAYSSGTGALWRAIMPPPMPIMPRLWVVVDVGAGTAVSSATDPQAAKINIKLAANHTIFFIHFSQFN
ncbi:MAG: hypothetical protein IPJ94_02900 [Chloroflexi bacterium]|nr:hypothetical protein [Chloroflexota bacterium]